MSQIRPQKSIFLLRQQFFTRIIFLHMRILDGKNHKGAAYERFVGDLLVYYLNGGRMWGFLDFPGNELDEETRERTNATFVTTRRELTDELIRTGFDEHGNENPSRRRVRASVGEAPIPIFDILVGWLARNNPHPALFNDGTIGIIERVPQPHGVEPEEYAREMAIYYFKDLLESPARTRIARCNNPACMKFYERKRMRKVDIKRGTYCGECKLIGSAERTKLSRRRRKEQLLTVAAHAWIEWKDRPRRTKRAAWVAIQVNRAFPRWAPIKAKWVSQNKALILSIAEGGQAPG